MCSEVGTFLDQQATSMYTTAHYIPYSPIHLSISFSVFLCKHVQIQHDPMRLSFQWKFPLHLYTTHMPAVSQLTVARSLILLFNRNLCASEKYIVQILTTQPNENRLSLDHGKPHL